MKRYRDPAQAAPQGYALKAWLGGGEAISTQVALFPLADYPGRVVTDLFGENAFFDDAAQFWTLQHQAISVLRARLLAEGWAKVEVLETGAYFSRWEYQPTEKQEGGGVWIAPRHNGEVVCHEGFLPLKAVRGSSRSTAGWTAEAANGASKTTRSEAPQALQHYIALHKAAAVRYQLTQHPALALRLAVASLIGGADQGSVGSDRPRPAVEASVAKGAAQDRFRAEWATVHEWLGDPSARRVTGWGGGERQTAEAFERLLGLSDAQVLKVLAVIAAEALTAGSGLAERVGEWLQLDMREFWQPDDTFVELLTDKEALKRLAAEVGAAPSGQATGTELRGLIRRRLKGEGCPPVENWLPRYFQFPSQGYTARPVSEARTAYDRLARCGSGTTLKAEDEAAFEDEETAWRVDDADEARIEWDAAAG